MAQGWGSRRLWAFVGLAILLAYAAWIGTPYLRSVVVRDAAVTTWINTTSAPIDGFLAGKPLHVGDNVGTDGLIATIENPLQDATPVVRAEADLKQSEATGPRLAGADDKPRIRRRGARRHGACRCQGRGRERGKNSRWREERLRNRQVSAGQSAAGRLCLEPDRWSRRLRARRRAGRDLGRLQLHACRRANIGRRDRTVADRRARPHRH